MNRGFTQVELMIVVSTIGLLLALAMPAYSRIRANSQKGSCLANQFRIESAMEQWAVEHAAQAATPPRATQIAAYLNNGRIPCCPGGGRYDYNTASNRIVCSIAEHQLP